MDKYIYFATELPMLSFGMEKYPAIEFFMEEAEKWMNESDLAVIKTVRLDDYDRRSAKGMYKDYLDFEYALRYELAEFRKAAKNGYEYKSNLLSPSVLKGENPLDKETDILKLHWDWLEEKEFSHYSDLDFICIYYLKLQILERLATFDKDKGAEVFSSVVEKSIEQDDVA